MQFTGWPDIQYRAILHFYLGYTVPTCPDDIIGRYGNTLLEGEYRATTDQLYLILDLGYMADVGCK